MNAHGPGAKTPAPPAPRDIALWCAGQGWPVFPLQGGKFPIANCKDCTSGKVSTHLPQACPCIDEGRWCHSFYAATLDPERIATWQPHWDVAVACGPAELVVIDIDAHTNEVPHRSQLLKGFGIPDEADLTGLTNGFHTLEVLAAYRGQTSPAEDQSTMRVRTPSGGMHVWYRRTGSQPELRCSVGSEPGGAGLAWQVDVRASGGYVVAPGVATSKGIYTPLPPATTVAPLPDWLLEDLLRTGHRKGDRERHQPPSRLPRVTQRSGSRAELYIGALLDDIRSCGCQPEGTGFTIKLNTAAYTAGGLVAGGVLDEAEAIRLLSDAAISARPHQAARIQRTIDAGLNQGKQRPLRPEGIA